LPGVAFAALVKVTPALTVTIFEVLQVPNDVETTVKVVVVVIPEAKGFEIVALSNKAEGVHEYATVPDVG
jgi:hypothetical protein